MVPILFFMLCIFSTTNAFVSEYKYNSSHSNENYSFTEIEPRGKVSVVKEINITLKEIPRTNDILVYNGKDWVLGSPPDLAYISTMANPTLSYNYYYGNGRTVYFGWNTVMVTNKIYYTNNYFHIIEPGTYELQCGFPNFMTNYNLVFRWYAMNQTDDNDTDPQAIGIANKRWFLKPIGSAGVSTEQRNIYKKSTSLNLARATVIIEKEGKFVVRTFGYGKVGYEPCEDLQVCNPYHGMSPWATLKQLSKTFYVHPENVDNINSFFIDTVHNVNGIATNL